MLVITDPKFNDSFDYSIRGAIEYVNVDSTNIIVYIGILKVRRK
jgi:hypothetical protein